MRLTFCAVLVLGFMAVAGTASALDPVELNPADCSFWSNGLDGFDEIGYGLWIGPTAIWDAVGFLDWNGTEMEPGDIPGFPLTWEVSDIDGIMVGDGLSDRLQLALLAASLCADDPLVTGQYEANLAAFAGLMTKFWAVITAATPLVGTLDADGDNLALLATEALTAGYINGATAGLLGVVAAGMTHVPTGEEDPGASQLLAAFVGTFSAYVPIFEGLAPWFVGMAGTSAAMDATIEDLMFNADPGYGIVADLAPAGAGLATLAGYVGTAAGMIGGLNGLPGITVNVAALVTALGADVTGLGGVVTIIGTISWPDMVIYGVSGKTATEPFSGTGDYNGNGDTNAQVEDAVGSDPATFVAAASGANVWYSGNPEMPVAGILGLALLAGACVMGGAASIRRK